MYYVTEQWDGDGSTGHFLFLSLRRSGGFSQYAGATAQGATEPEPVLSVPVLFAALYKETTHQMVRQLPFSEQTSLSV